jgi:hypothetical protein
MIFEVFLLWEIHVTVFGVETLRIVEYCACSKRPVYHVSCACFTNTTSCGLSSNVPSHLDISPPSTLSEGVTVLRAGTDRCQTSLFYSFFKFPNILIHCTLFLTVRFSYSLNRLILTPVIIARFTQIEFSFRFQLSSNHPHTSRPCHLSVFLVYKWTIIFNSLSY